MLFSNSNFMGNVSSSSSEKALLIGSILCDCVCEGGKRERERRERGAMRWRVKVLHISGVDSTPLATAAC